MSVPVPYFKAFDPAVAASTTTQDHGGGLISGNGTYISKHTDIPRGYHIGCVIDIVSTAGPLTGTVTVEVSNSTKQDDENNGGLWVTYDNLPVAIPAVSGSDTFGIELINLPFARMRTKFVTTAGTGTIEEERAVK